MKETYQDSRLRQELSEALPFYNSQEYDDFDSGGDQFDSNSRGVVKPVVRTPAEPYNQRPPAKKEKGIHQSAKPARYDSKTKHQPEPVPEEKDAQSGFFGSLWGRSKKKSDSTVAYVFDDTEFPKKALRELYGRGKLKAPSRKSRAGRGGAGDVPGLDLKGGRVSLNDRLRKLDFDRLTETKMVDKPRGRSKPGRRRDNRVRGSAARTKVARVSKVSSSESESESEVESETETEMESETDVKSETEVETEMATATDTDNLRTVKKSRSFPDLHTPHPRHGDDGEKHRPQAQGMMRTGGDHETARKGSLPRVRPSVSDTLMDRPSSRQTGAQSRQRFPDRIRQRRIGERRGEKSPRDRHKRPSNTNKHFRGEVERGGDSQAL
ncbi:hypothetical protein EGW08_005121 [Elysia chlorotica]|uniref:Uncharacterized protein n=1 Tax=Elysia chlorotica TaxID=188477 RepID=A0A433TZW1_ELYCH|nr:hypothetical protein EGW08_005121 [Elysia chlorotica]